MGRHKGTNDHDKIGIDSTIVRKIFEDNGLTIRSLGMKNREHYIGWSDKTIGRALKNGYMSLGLYDALMKEVDISSAITMNESYLVGRVSLLEEQVKSLDERVRWLESVI